MLNFQVGQLCAEPSKRTEGGECAEPKGEAEPDEEEDEAWEEDDMGEGRLGRD